MGVVSISKLIAKNYKNLRMEDGIDFGKLTVFMGSNGSGKSNAISLLQFLQDCVEAQGTFDRRGRTNFEDAVFRLGWTRVLDGSLHSPSTVGIEFHFAIDGKETVLGVDLLVQDIRHQVLLEREVLYAAESQTGEPNHYFMHSSSEGSNSGSVAISFAPGSLSLEWLSRNHVFNLNDVPANELMLSSLPRILEETALPPGAVPKYGPRGVILDRATSWRFYQANNMDLDRIRMSDPRLGQGDYYVSVTGENLALVLFNLNQAEYEFEEFVSEAFGDLLPITKRLRVVPIGRYALTIEWYAEGYNEPFLLSDMSDGTIRMLCWAVILHSPRPPTLIVIEEPELGIHPAWMPILADWIKRATQKTQVIVTTHSPDLLDHFTDQLDDGYIYAFQRDFESQSHFKPKRLDRDAISGWLEDGWQLGDLYRVGNPAVGGWPW